MMHQGLRLFHTARYLRLQQMGYRLWYRLRRPAPDLRLAPPIRPLPENWVIPVGKPAAMVAKGRFRFLNEEHAASSAADWNNPAVPKLWLYNLHYFDDLCAADAATRRDQHLSLIRRWIAENSPGHGNGWEPYPLSLRIVNWVKWVLAGNELPLDAGQSLAVQARHLRKCLEYHLLGNHLWGNAKALVFAGLFFAGEEAEEWLKKGLVILDQEIGEQILPDGGHFERSPMYHAIILEDLLDLVNLFQSYGVQAPANWLDALARMRRWLQTMRHPDGEIVLFNDAAFGIAPRAAALEAYADRLRLGPAPTWDDETAVHLWNTGYLRLQQGEAMAFLDVGPIGPDYIPGHAHADTLNFELSLCGQRVIVDSGTSTYEKNSERQRQRGTSAHNTVQINGEDSSEVWGGFRVARRARPFGLSIEERPDEVHVSCAHDGYRRLKGQPIHRRVWVLGQKDLSIHDTIEGKFREAIVRYHFHPEVQVELSGKGAGRGILPGGQGFVFNVSGGVARLIDTTYHPEFNVSLPTRCLEVAFEGAACQLFFSWS
ncbi:MAG: heparinase II/III family protein [Desulfuromonadales bacterium]